MKLIGNKKYSFSNHINPETELQLKIINQIEEKLGVVYKGTNSREAYAFIQDFHSCI